MSNEIEFGGRSGVISLILFSHFILYYMYYCINLNDGNIFIPTCMSDIHHALDTLIKDVTPTLASVLIYFSFLGLEALFAVYLPGLLMMGRPDENGLKLKYKCNALLSWYVSLALVFAFQIYSTFTGVKTVSMIPDILGKLMSTSIIFADLFSLVLYVIGVTYKMSERMTGDPIYDFFMGAILHPRIGLFDLKLWAEIRISWFILFGITLSCAIKQFETFGNISPSMFFMVLAHFLYANACAKGEHYVPSTWDIFYEKFGWMLCFWNFAGVPFLYCAQSVYILRQSIDHNLFNIVPSYLIAVYVVVLFVAYYFWDSAQSQKNHFRLESTGVVINRNTFPQMPWNTIKNPRYIKTEKGTPLLIDGWWKYARKIHYTADIIMALLWGLSCGFRHFLPYFYFFFFTAMIIHRNQRDMERCSKKYGKDWQRYVKEVPYVFIPGVY